MSLHNDLKEAREGTLNIKVQHAVSALFSSVQLGKRVTERHMLMLDYSAYPGGEDCFMPEMYGMYLGDTDDEVFFHPDRCFMDFPRMYNATTFKPMDGQLYYYSKYIDISNVGRELDMRKITALATSGIDTIVTLPGHGVSNAHGRCRGTMNKPWRGMGSGEGRTDQWIEYIDKDNFLVQNRTPEQFQTVIDNNYIRMTLTCPVHVRAGGSNFSSYKIVYMWGAMVPDDLNKWRYKKFLGSDA